MDKNIKNSLPVFELVLDDNSDMYAISLVNSPAMESNWFAFSKQKEYQLSTNDEKMELLGVLAIPDKKIYRRNDNGYEFEIFFTKETIRKAAQKFMMSGYQNNTNLNHSSVPANCYVFQSFIVDEKLGISSPKGMDAPDGSLIVGMKVTDKKVWEDIKAGKINGFSLEGFFKEVQVELSKQDYENRLVELITEMNNIIEKIK